MSIPFEANLGQVKVYYQRSAKYGLGRAHCWVDDDGKTRLNCTPFLVADAWSVSFCLFLRIVKGKVRLDGYWQHDYSIVV